MPYALGSMHTSLAVKNNRVLLWPGLNHFRLATSLRQAFIWGISWEVTCEGEERRDSRASSFACLFSRTAYVLEMESLLAGYCVLFYFLLHQLLPQDGPFVLYFWPPVIHIYGAKNVSIMKTLRWWKPQNNSMKLKLWLKSLRFR